MNRRPGAAKLNRFRKAIPMHMSRRSFLYGGTAVAALGAGAFLLRPMDGSNAAEGTFEVSFTEDEWRAKLDPKVFEVLRHEATERAGTSPLNNEHRRGTFSCAGCSLPLFQSAWKFDSGTGWPSFFRAMNENIGRQTDRSLGMVRTEYHCAQCLGHQGHLFDDGPRPTGLRYCNNGVALKFIPQKA